MTYHALKIFAEKNLLFQTFLKIRPNFFCGRIHCDNLSIGSDEEYLSRGTTATIERPDTNLVI